VPRGQKCEEPTYLLQFGMKEMHEKEMRGIGSSTKKRTTKNGG
jgi:hypothetical protein